MTVESITPRVEYDYTGADDYTFLFECVDEDHLTLTHISTAGVSTVLTINVDYTVTLSETIGGTCAVTYSATTGTLRIARSTPVTQEVNLVNNNALDMETLESALDRNVLILQEFELRLASALQASTWRGDWETTTSYGLLDLVATPTGDWYSCVVAHTSGTWSTDLAAGYWELIFPFSDVEDFHTEIETWHGEVDTWQGEVDTNATAAAASADLAEEWAEKAEDSAITGHAGQYSALHHAAKAAASAASIDLPAIGAGDAGKVLFVKATEDGYELDDITTDYYVEAGTIRAWATETPPTGYLECDGSAISRTTYSTLFGIIADAYGAGDGSSTFNLPDYRGEFLRGWDHAAGNDPDAASRTDSGDGTTGDHIGTKQGARVQSHAHQMVGGAYAAVLGGASNFTGTSGGVVLPYNTGSTGGSETRPRNINVMWIIKY